MPVGVGGSFVCHVGLVPLRGLAEEARRRELLPAHPGQLLQDSGMVRRARLAAGLLPASQDPFAPLSTMNVLALVLHCCLHVPGCLRVGCQASVLRFPSAGLGVYAG